MDQSNGPAVHPGIEPLAFLIGTWEGTGSGQYPTIAPFTYGEEIRIGHVGRPFLSYSQRTWDLADGRALHGEVGYWRMRADGGVELLVAHPTGIVEIEEGRLEGSVIELTSELVGTTASAKAVTVLSRRFALDGEVLTYRLEMAALGEPTQPHLEAVLRRSD